MTHETYFTCGALVVVAAVAFASCFGGIYKGLPADAVALDAAVADWNRIVMPTDTARLLAIIDLDGNGTVSREELATFRRVLASVERDRFNEWRKAHP